MSSRLYRDHFIMAFPSFDTATNGWAPQADISWNHASSHRKFAFLKFPKRFMTQEEAIRYALDMAQAWVDNRPSQSRSHIVGSDRRQVGAVAADSNQSQPQAISRQPRGPRVLPQWRVEKIFTFGEFKSAIGESGLRINEQTLQKSYTALDRLRQNKHMSWAETRRKVERLQRDFQAVKSAMRQLRAARIPLTERDWGRIE